MSYSGALLDKIEDNVGGQVQEWWYRTTDSIATVQGAGYFSDGVKRGMKLGALVFVFKTDTNDIFIQRVSAVDAGFSSGLYTATVADVSAQNNASIGGNLAVTGNLTVGGTVALGDAVSDTIGFYGVTKVTQRAGSNQASSNVVTSASFGTLQVAQLQEVYNTLAGLGAWKGAA
jgi:uncharacterized membrane protein